MAAWEALLQKPTWTSPPLINLRASRATMEQCLGPAHIVGADSNGRRHLGRSRSQADVLSRGASDGRGLRLWRLKP
jgi:hypothetical protein